MLENIPVSTQTFKYEMAHLDQRLDAIVKLMDSMNIKIGITDDNVGRLVKNGHGSESAPPIIRKRRSPQGPRQYKRYAAIDKLADENHHFSMDFVELGQFDPRYSIENVETWRLTQGLIRAHLKHRFPGAMLTTRMDTNGSLHVWRGDGPHGVKMRLGGGH